MKLLLDTHSFLWFIAGSSHLSTQAQALIESDENQAFLSVASLWEMAIKVSLGKLSLDQPFEPFIARQLDLNGIEILGINLAHTAAVAGMPFHHRDPFDRLIIAQSQIERMPVVSGDPALDQYLITRLW